MWPWVSSYFIVSIYQHAYVALYSSKCITAITAGLAQGWCECDTLNGIGRVTVLGLVMIFVWQHLNFRPQALIIIWRTVFQSTSALYVWYQMHWIHRTHSKWSFYHSLLSHLLPFATVRYCVCYCSLLRSLPFAIVCQPLPLMWILTCHSYLLLQPTMDHLSACSCSERQRAATQKWMANPT